MSLPVIPSLQLLPMLLPHPYSDSGIARSVARFSRDAQVTDTPLIAGPLETAERVSAHATERISYRNQIARMYTAEDLVSWQDPCMKPLSHRVICSIVVHQSLLALPQQALVVASRHAE